MVIGIVFSCDLLAYDLEIQFGIISITFVATIDAVAFAFHCFRIVFSTDKITYDGENIDFGKGYIVKPSQIKNVEYHNSYITSRTDVWGSLTVELNDFVVKYPCIDRVGEVCKRLVELKNKDLKRETELIVTNQNEE